MKTDKRIWILIILILGSLSYSQNLKLMSYNIRLDVASDGQNAWPVRKDFFASQIQFYEPDIMGVQEAMPNQVLDLEQMLPHYNQVGIGREGEGKGESSNIFYKKEKLKVITTNTFWLSETPDAISKGWDAACHRVCTFALFQDITSKRKFWIFNTHLDHIGEQARANGIKLILSKIEQYNTDQYPIVFMGDFNLEPNDKSIVALKMQMNDASEISLQKPFGPNGTFNNFEFDKPVTRRIDYIFISKNAKFEVKKYAVLTDSKNFRYPSDHFPVYVEIK
ncbi:endonuclease [Flavobacterium ammoniigenes]|jgi:endonuclease/exonuclease/phosphatase family metal-dependent hydrolase|uniref:Endonuclease n=1 Tax=Flavobacterium ammoniigenes TaxID=1751095 RepID=A0ABN6KYX1_9FLAO|nr:endonuclease/exonuclease/phosphatase family protein [Flavobacterium ammoniigenes]BDB54614.1 endonuclease [Flavobacterium ammoniigenes]